MAFTAEVGSAAHEAARAGMLPLRLRTLPSIAAVLLALAVIVALSVASVSREQARLTDEFTTVTHQEVHTSVDALAARLDALDQDTRMLTDLVEHPADPAADRRVWDSAFRALAVVIAQYRTIALIGADGTLEVVASDPDEAAETVDALLPPIRRLARDVVTAHARAIGETARYGDRSFLLYGTPVRDGRAIVVASDAAVFLGAVAWMPLPSARLFVTDPAGVVWTGCETPTGCRAAASGTVPASDDVAPPRPSQVAARGGRVVHPPRIPAVQVAERLDRPTGTWIVTWLASTRAIVDREQAMVARVVLTAIAAAVAVAAVAAVVLRHQRNAAALEGRLQTAQALASARQGFEQQLVRAEKLITVGVLSAGMAHEIGTPLAVIRGRAQQVLRSVVDEARAEDLRVIIKHIDNIATTIRQVLDFSRRQPIERQAVSLGAVAQQARELLRWKLEAKHQQLGLALEDDLPLVAADPDQLQQVLVNLLLNACDASGDGDVVTVTARARTLKGKRHPVVQIEVSDRGCGIAPEHMNAVFDPFFTTKKRGEGTGLGLSNAANIVRNHGGAIDLTSEPGKGTTVTVTWPTDPSHPKRRDA